MLEGFSREARAIFAYKKGAHIVCGTLVLGF